jgi:hypothetical protein
MAKFANGAVYAELARTDRTEIDDESLVHMAHAAAYHWRQAGTATELMRAEYLVSRAYAFTGDGVAALRHAEWALRIADELGAVDFDRAFVHEGMARALACAGRLEDARSHFEQARTTKISDDEDRAIVEADMAEPPWFGLQ